MPTLLALHDREGDENDLPPVLRMVAPGWNVLSPRLTGDVEELVRWIQANAASAPCVFAYGSGADLAVQVLMRHKGVVAGGVLLRPSELEPGQQSGALNGAPLLIITGGDGECTSLARTLTEAGAEVDFAVNSNGRSLTPQDFALARQWLSETGSRFDGSSTQTPG